MTSLFSIMLGLLSLAVYFGPGWAVMRFFRRLEVSTTASGKVSLMILISSAIFAIPAFALSLASLTGLKLFMLALTTFAMVTIPFMLLDVLAHFRRSGIPRSRFPIVGIVAGCVGVLLLSLSHPRVEWDAIRYYLPDAFLYMKYDRIPYYNTFDFSGGSPVVTPPFGPLAYALGFIITGSAAGIPQYMDLVPVLVLTPFIFFLGTLASIYELTMQVQSKNSLAIAATWVAATHPLILRYFELTPLYVDVYFLFFATTAFALVFRAKEARYLALFLSSLACSLSILTKSFGVVAFIFLAAPLLVELQGSAQAQHTKLARIRGMILTSAVLGAGSLTGMVWLFRNFILTGSPFAWGLPQLILQVHPELKWAYETTQKAWAGIPQPGGGLLLTSTIIDPSIEPVLLPLVLLGAFLCLRNHRLLRVSAVGLLFGLFFVIVLRADDIRHAMLLIPIQSTLASAGLERVFFKKTVSNNPILMHGLSVPILIGSGISGMIFSPSFPGLWYAIIPSPSAYWFFYEYLYLFVPIIFGLAAIAYAAAWVSKMHRGFMNLATLALVFWLILLPMPALVSSHGNQSYFDALSSEYFGWGRAVQYVLAQPAHGKYLLTYISYGVKGFTDLETVDLADALHLYKIFPVIRSSNLTWAFSQLQALGLVYAILPNLKEPGSFVASRFFDMTYNSAPLPILVSLNNPRYWNSIEFGGWTVYTLNQTHTGLGVLDIILGDQSGARGSVYVDGLNRLNTAENLSLSLDGSRILLYMDTSTLANSPILTNTTINYATLFNDGHKEQNSTSAIGNSSPSLFSVNLQPLVGSSGAIRALYIQSIRVSITYGGGLAVVATLIPINSTVGFPLYLNGNVFTIDRSLSSFTYLVS